MAPACFAARRLAAVTAAALSERAGVMPDTWYQSTPSKMAPQSNSVGSAMEMAAPSRS